MSLLSMSVPRPPINFSNPIPNQPFDYPESYYLETNQGHLPLGEGLYINPETGAFTNIEPSPYIYCTPAYPELPPSSPPYGCDTEVNTEGVTDFGSAWFNCQYLVDFPCVDSSKVVNFSYSWTYCFSLTSFPALNVSSGKYFYAAWAFCSSLETFPLLNVSSGVDFNATWVNCDSLTTFPSLDFSKSTLFQNTWLSCGNLTSFPERMFDNSTATNFYGAWQDCALDQTSVDNILVSIDTAGQNNGTVSLNGGTSSTPGPAGLAAKTSLESKGWTVLTN